MPSCLATAFAVVRLSPVSMMTLMPSAASVFRASGVDGFTGSAIEDADKAAVDCNVDDRRSISTEPFSLSVQRLCFDARRLQEGGVAKQDRLVFDFARHALAGGRVEIRRLTQAKIPLLGRTHDRVGKGMFTRSFDAGCEPKDFVLLKSSSRDDRDDPRLAFGQRPRLVDHQGVDPFQALKGFGVLDQDAGLGATTD